MELEQFNQPTIQFLDGMDPNCWVWTVTRRVQFFIEHGPNGKSCGKPIDAMLDCGKVCPQLFAHIPSFLAKSTLVQLVIWWFKVSSHKNLARLETESLF